MKQNNFKLSITFSFTAIIFMLFVSCSTTLTESERLHKKNPIGMYGKKIDLEQFSDFGGFMSEPNEYLNENILIKGEIIDVCPMRGCWIKVKDNSSSNSIRVKVTDGLIVFPISSKGHQVDVEGEFIALNFTENQARSWKVHLAKEKGITLNPEDVQIEKSDLIEYRIVGKGAEIY